MITGYQQLTGKYLKASLRRTILTTIGIILSVALISSIGFFIKGIRDAELQNVKNDYGSAHLFFTKVDTDLLTRVTEHPKVLKSGLYTQGETEQLTKDLPITETIVTDQALELLPIHVSKGRIPENPREAAVEKWVIRYIDPTAQLGDTIRLFDREYILVGLLEDQIGNQIDHRASLVTKSAHVEPEKAILLVEINPKANLAKAVDELKQFGEEGTVTENYYLWMMLGVGEGAGQISGIFVSVGIIIAIVVIATIAVIYNAFQISVVERVKQFGLLRTIGATPKQIRKIVFREAALLAIIGIPVGLLFGVIAILVIGVIFAHLVDDTLLSVQTAIAPSIFIISSLVGLLSIFISALIPALFAGRISPLVAVSSRALISKEKIKRRKNWLWRKLLGFEGELAIKNIKRNPKRYRITVFSIIISVVLFVTFTSFMDMTLNISETYNESKKVHFSIIRDNSMISIDESIVDQIKAIGCVQEIYRVYNPGYFSVLMNLENELTGVPALQGLTTRITWNGAEKTLLPGSIMIYDEASLAAAEKYVEAGSIDLDRFNRENGVIIINKNTLYNRNTQNSYYGPVARLKVGDELELQFQEQRGEGQKAFGAGQVHKVKVLAIVDEEPFNFRGTESGLKMITTEEVGMQLMAASRLKPINLNILIDDVQNEEIARTELEKVITPVPSLRVVNLIDQNRKSKSAILMIQILLYGFVVVVSCIGSVNIINTITTNIILRKRELSTLKAIGLTQSGLKKMIIFEGILYGIVGTIYGSIIACGLSYLIYRGLMSAREFLWQIPWFPILIAAIASLAIGYLSVLAPLARIKRENLIDAVREDY